MLTQEEIKNLMYITGEHSVRDLAVLLSDHIDCDNCKLKSRCPVVIEYDEFERYGWWKDPVNTCVDTIDYYIRTGMIRDKRNEKKKEEES